MKLKINASFSGVISRGSYENSRPGFSADLEFDFEGDSNNPAELKHCLESNQKFLHDICYQNFKACEEQAIIERINRERADLRIIQIDGKSYPSVTSVIGFDADMFCSPEELSQYASQGNICHSQVEHFISTGKWEEAKDVPDTWADIVILTKGSLKLETGGWDFPAFLEKFPIKNMKNAGRSYNEKYQYCGQPDFVGIPDFEGAEKVLTIFDVKRTMDKIKNCKQMAAYAKMKGYEDVKQICVVPLNNKTKQGYSKPYVETRIDQYFDMFKKDRKAFKNRFGV